MTDALETLARWVIPALIVFGVTALVSVGAIWALRRARRSPRARAAAEAERTAAGSALIALDDAVEELDLEVALSGALYDGTAPPALRRARMTAQHARDAAFEQLRQLTPDSHPDEIRRVARGIRARTAAADSQITRARAEHTAWMQAHVGAAAQVTAARDRCEGLRRELGDPDALVAELEARVDETESAGARSAAERAVAALAEADRLLAEAEARATDPTRSALPALADAERALRRGQLAARALEEHHRLVTEASLAVGGEIEQARAALLQAGAVRDGLEPADAERLGRELREMDAALTALAPSAGRRPTAAVAEIARLRGRLDLALGDARTAQQRLRGARSALPGTLAAARGAVGRAEAVAARAGADARVRLAAAQHELAAARGAEDPVTALDAARRALRHADDAVALADYDRLTRD
jgi:hypothetical protein